MSYKKKMGPGLEREYAGIPFNNATIKRMAMQKQQQKQVKDVERYDPNTGKSSMIYKPGRG